MGKNKKPDIKCDIKQLYGYLNEDKSIVVALVSWNDRKAKLDIRKCWRTDDDELRLGSGIGLTDSELDELTELLINRRNGKLHAVSEDGKKAVDFNEIFRSSSGIVDKRSAGYTTTDGFITLKKRPGVKLK